MNWATARTALKAVVLSASGLTAAGSVDWQGTKTSESFRPYPRIYLSVSPLRGVGIDGERWELDNVGNATVRIEGQRQCTLSIRVESDDQDNGTAMTIGDRIRMRLRRKSMMAALNDAGFSQASILAMTILQGVKHDSRELAVVNIDVLLNAVDKDTDDTEFSGDYIEATHVQSDPLYMHDSDNDDEDEIAHIQVNEEISRYA